MSSRQKFVRSFRIWWEQVTKNILQLQELRLYTASAMAVVISDRIITLKPACIRNVFGSTWVAVDPT